MKERARVSIAVGAAILIMTTGSIEAKRKALSPPDPDVILRAPTEEIGGILTRHGLQALDCRQAPGAGGMEICLARGPQSSDPQHIVDDVISAEPEVAGVEVAALASLPESYDDIVLDQDASAIAGLLGNLATVPFGSDGSGASRQVWQGYVDQPAAQLVRATAAQSLYTGQGVIVAIIDTGVDSGHPLLAGHLVAGYDFLLGQAGDASDWQLLDESSMAILGESSMAILGSETVAQLNESSMAILGAEAATAFDPAVVPASFGHGTMVAGIVHRVAPEAKIMPLRVFDGEGRASIDDIIRAIEYAVDYGATVINMSFSFESYSEELMRTVKYAKKQGVVCVGSAGNDAQEALVYPAALGYAFGVAATDLNDGVSDFSNRGDDLVTLAAPGEQVITAYPGGGWASVAGTSFAAPWVSGAVALFADKSRAGGPDSLKFNKVDHALSNADPVSGADWDTVGYGRIDIKSAVDGL